MTIKKGALIQGILQTKNFKLPLGQIRRRSLLQTGAVSKPVLQLWLFAWPAFPAAYRFYINRMGSMFLRLKASGKQQSGSSCDGNYGSLFTSSLGNALAFVFVVRSSRGFYGSMGALHQCWFEVDSGTCDPDRLLLTGRFIVAGCQTRPAA